MFSTNNPVLLRRHRTLPAIICIQRNTTKIIPTEKDLIKTNRDGMGNKVGTITNRVTAMMEIQSRFDPNSKEYKELEYRIACGQLYQQDELDKLKGIIAKPMPKYWYNYKACNDDSFLKSICVAKKPYFMIYIYDDYRRDYRNYYKEANQDVLSQLGISLSQLLRKNKHSRKEKRFLEYYNAKMPFGIGKCAMNRICWYIEEQFDKYVTYLKKEKDFDYTFLKYNVQNSSKYVEQLKDLEKEYILMNKEIKGFNYHDHSPEAGQEQGKSKYQLKRYVRSKAEEICPDEDERTDIFLDMYYKHGCHIQFFWDCVGLFVVKRLEDMVYGNSK